MPYAVNLHPNRISITPHHTPDRTDWEPEAGTWAQDIDIVKHFERMRSNSLANLSIKGNPFLISKSGKRRLQDRIMAMYRLSTPRTVKAGGRKLIYNFRCAFVTLTLPATQMHADKEIKSDCLNQLFVELRRFYNVENYVWKAELQLNENIHFHIIIDRFVSYYALRRRWNRILDKLGYIERFASRMSEMGVERYHANALRYNDKATFAESKSKYERGMAEGWKNPNSVDVKVVKSDRDIVTYMSKYMTKEIVDTDKEEYSDAEIELLNRGENFGRAWFCSRSLSRLRTAVSFSLNQITKELKEIVNTSTTKLFQGDYFKVYYFRYEDLSKRIQHFMRGWLMSNAYEDGYIFPI